MAPITDQNLKSISSIKPKNYPTISKIIQFSYLEYNNRVLHATKSPNSKTIY